jgi:hypothetical protein
MLTYTAFIDELRTLVPRGMALAGSDRLSENAEFKRWRHETICIIDLIQALGYRINCHIKIRRFNIYAPYGSVSAKTRCDQFDTDLADTVAELEVLIASFDKHGDPNTRPPTPSGLELTKPLTLPKKGTMAWLWQDAPASLLKQLAGAAIVIFGSGIAVGQSAFYAEWVTMLKPPTQPAAAARK